MPASPLLVDFLAYCSVETTPGAVEAFAASRDHLPPGTSVYIVAPPGRDLADGIAAAIRLRREGFNPVPHIPARGIASRRQLDGCLARMCGEAAVTQALVIGGSALEPAGPYRSAMQLLETGLPGKHGIRTIGIAGHPEGHPTVSEAEMMDALTQKKKLAERSDAAFYIVTQFCFDPAAIIGWDRRVGGSANRLPVHVGVPGLTSPQDLIRFAGLCEIGPSVRLLRRETGRLLRLATTWTPEPLLEELARYRASDANCAIERVHFFTFGGVRRTLRWLAALRERDID